VNFFKHVVRVITFLGGIGAQAADAYWSLYHMATTIDDFHAGAAYRSHIAFFEKDEVAGDWK
jgi:hypothetical protein